VFYFGFSLKCLGRMHECLVLVPLEGFPLFKFFYYFFFTFLFWGPVWNWLVQMKFSGFFLYVWIFLKSECLLFLLLPLFFLVELVYCDTCPVYLYIYTYIHVYISHWEICHLLHLYVYIHAYIYICHIDEAYTCTHTHTRICYACTHTSKKMVSEYACIWIQPTNAHIQTHTQARARTHTHTRTLSHIHIQTHMHSTMKTPSFVWYCSFTRVTWLIHNRDTGGECGRETKERWCRRRVWSSTRCSRALW